VGAFGLCWGGGAGGGGVCGGGGVVRGVLRGAWGRVVGGGCVGVGGGWGWVCLVGLVGWGGGKALPSSFLFIEGATEVSCPT